MMTMKVGREMLRREDIAELLLIIVVADIAEIIGFADEDEAEAVAEAEDDDDEEEEDDDDDDDADDEAPVRGDQSEYFT